MEGGGQYVNSQTESAIQQENGITVNDSVLLSQDFVTQNAPVITEHETEDKSFSSSPETSTSSHEDSVEIVDSEVELRNNEPRDYTQMVDDGDDDHMDMNMIPPDMLQASETLSDVQKPTKKMRVTVET